LHGDRGKKSRAIVTMDDDDDDDDEQYSLIAAVKTTLKTVNKRKNEAGLLSNNAKLNTHVLPEKIFEPSTLFVSNCKIKTLYAMKKKRKAIPLTGREGP
jgi:hypothetical protein